MTKISRVDLSKLTDNSDLMNNDNEDRFSVSDMLGKMNEGEFNIESIVSDYLPSTLDVSVSINTNDSGDKENALEGDFNATRDINDFHIQILMEAMKTAYAQYRKSGSSEDLQNVISVSHALETAKKGLLSTHKDITKIHLDKSRIARNSGGLAEGVKTINIQNNTFTGTPNDVLKEFGNAIDLKDDEYVIKDEETT